MKVTLKDGSVKEYAQAMSVIDIAKDLSEGLARAACAGEVDGEVVDLRTVVDHDAAVNILTAKDEKGLAALRHTTSQAPVSQHKAGDRSLYRRRLLLRYGVRNSSDQRRF